MNKLRTVTLAAALLVASVPSLSTTAQARPFGFHGGFGGGWGHGGWGGGGWGGGGWGGAGLGLGLGVATGALVGAALARPYYGYGYGYPYGGYGGDYGGYGGDYAGYGGDYAGYGSDYAYDYAPAYTTTYAAAPVYGYRNYAHRNYGYGVRRAEYGYGVRHAGYRTAYVGRSVGFSGHRGGFARAGYGRRFR
jgi:hypothetical protein